MSKLFLAPEFRLKLEKFETKLLTSQATIETSKRFASQDCSYLSLKKQYIATVGKSQMHHFNFNSPVMLKEKICGMY